MTLDELQAEFPHDAARTGRPAKALDDFVRLSQMETDECVIWPRGLTEDGYGQLATPDRSKRWRAHRLALLLRSEPLTPDAMALHGPCHDRRCINYRHLYWGDAAQNQEDRRRDGTLPPKPAVPCPIIEPTTIRPASRSTQHTDDMSLWSCTFTGSPQITLHPAEPGATEGRYTWEGTQP